MKLEDIIINYKVDEKKYKELPRATIISNTELLKGSVFQKEHMYAKE